MIFTSSTEKRNLMSRDVTFAFLALLSVKQNFSHITVLLHSRRTNTLNALKRKALEDNVLLLPEKKTIVNQPHVLCLFAD